jgi:pimeloyl-ACP methyl ester carboxylesterase
MKRSIVVFLLICFVAMAALGQTKTKRIKYGSNPAAGKTFTHGGVKLYYEVYGRGEPLLVVHGNGGSILDVAKQIDYFRTRYRVIAMDSRDQGRSADTPDKLTYEKMTDDLAALLDHLKTGPVYVIGWSDGGIEALLLGIRHPEKVKKIVSMAANLNPSDKAVRPEALEFIKSLVKEIPPAQRDSPQVKRELKATEMMLVEPNIPLESLRSIKAPTLILAADHDVIDDHHTVDIYQNIENSQLAIFPNATHAIPFDDPPLFNSTIERFLKTPFVKKDRIGDLMKSIGKMRGQ